MELRQAKEEKMEISNRLKTLKNEKGSFQVSYHAPFGEQRIWMLRLEVSSFPNKEAAVKFFEEKIAPVITKYARDNQEGE